VLFRSKRQIAKWEALSGVHDRPIGYPAKKSGLVRGPVSLTRLAVEKLLCEASMATSFWVLVENAATNVRFERTLIVLVALQLPSALDVAKFNLVVLLRGFLSATYRRALYPLFPLHEVVPGASRIWDL
jgi:hypothetical protein